jgi:propanol-preferring alcohol dehydrogenase
MKAMLLQEINSLAENPAPLTFEDVPDAKSKTDEVLIRVKVCGVCHTELDEIEGRTPPSQLPRILGHQVVGIVEVTSIITRPIGLSRTLRAGDRVGVAWIASACGHCEQCLSGHENLCSQFKATGRDVNGGYAEYMTARADFVHPIPESLSDAEAAPLLCAGAVGYRALKLANIEDGQALGLMGFGGSNHLVLKMAKYKYPNSDIFVFSRNAEEREFAKSLGAAWTGAIDETPLTKLNAVIDTTPVWVPIMEALKYLNPGGRLVVNGIRKEEIDKDVLLKLDYASQLWMEKEIKSVANVTRQDVREFLSLAAEANLKPEFQEFDLKDANAALLEMKQGKIRGAKVLRVS